ncbi:hypothetical protein B296_00013053 [Ensete ventricosum]|uniref:Uncharacterized protein n=1 Tax=Ensete ventricosum TaxID=4639 RepID=A0A427AZC4_ENSVE|nr:hypothetical protein B296_00013053 [Ensete ventricosum]
MGGYQGGNYNLNHHRFVSYEKNPQVATIAAMGYNVESLLDGVRLLQSRREGGSVDPKEGDKDCDVNGTDWCSNSRGRANLGVGGVDARWPWSRSPTRKQAEGLGIEKAGPGVAKRGGAIVEEEQS